ncbi:MAG: hypothetical protein IJZ04_10460 [Clostridia bacterium]|nr:hypothetical protein [Clostridia bacterium]MBQ8739899.1 hypothetical protein [Clostridia bacterium]
MYPKKRIIYLDGSHSLEKYSGKYARFNTDLLCYFLSKSALCYRLLENGIAISAVGMSATELLRIMLFEGYALCSALDENEIFLDVRVFACDIMRVCCFIEEKFQGDF